MLDRIERSPDDARRFHALEGGWSTPSHVQEPPDDVLDAIRLRQDRLRSASCTLVVADLGEELLGAPDDDPERCGHLVSDPHGESAHGGHALGLEQLLVPRVLRLGDRELALQLELLALPSKRHAAEDEHQARCHEYAEHESPYGSFLPIPLARG
ncbi:MAG: hypothetical protein ABSE49_03815 [Polyangiaceae bacterium]